MKRNRGGKNTRNIPHIPRKTAGYRDISRKIAPHIPRQETLVPEGFAGYAGLRGYFLGVRPTRGPMVYSLHNSSRVYIEGSRKYPQIPARGNEPLPGLTFSCGILGSHIPRDIPHIPQSSARALQEHFSLAPLGRIR